MMSRASETHIGEGQPAVVLEETQHRWQGMEVIFRSDDIRRPTDWRIQEDWHSVVVHLGGQMQRLETELDGFGGSTGPALPGEIWTAPAERKYASHARGTQIHYALIRVPPTAQDIIRGTRHGYREIVPLAGHRDEFLHQSVKKLQDAIKRNDDVSEMLAETLCKAICLHILDTYRRGRRLLSTSKVAPGPELKANVARQVREFIYENLCGPINLHDLAKLTGMTTHQLLIAFRKAFRTTPAQYVIQQRLRRAQRQLLESRNDITQIALDCGFSSHSHLTAYFVKHFGCTPSSFRVAGCRANLEKNSFENSE